MKILLIGDLHAPFVCHKTLKAIYKAIEELDPTHIIQMGDAYDMYSWSKFPKSINDFTPMQELKAGRKELEKMWEKIKQEAPRARCYQLKGNHCVRVEKRLIEKAPEFEGLLDLSQYFEFDGVKTMPCDREELLLGDVVFMHGYRSKLGEHARNNNENTACGHSHRGGVFYFRSGDETLFEVNAGCAADLTSKVMSYARQRRFSNMTNGFAFIDKWGPRFISLTQGKTWRKQ